MFFACKKRIRRNHVRPQTRTVLPANGKQVIQDLFPALENLIFIGAEAVKILQTGLCAEKYYLFYSAVCE